jgi:hypothetical protein
LPTAAGSVAVAAIASTTKSTGTTLNGAPARPNWGIGHPRSAPKATTRSMK